MSCDSDAEPCEKASRVLIYVSSDEGSPVVVARRGLNRVKESLPEGDRGLSASDPDDDDDDDDVVVIGEFSPKLKPRKPKVGCHDEDCLVLDGDPNEPVSVQCDPCNEVQVVAEKGQVACRDYPHARYDCTKFPFGTTPHEKHCDLCHCYVCDSLAPCTDWGTGLFGHCNANYKDISWRFRRELRISAARLDKRLCAALTTQMNGLKP